MLSPPVWNQTEGPPKGGRTRTLKLAPRLREALAKHRHLRGPNVLWTQRGTLPASTAPGKWLAKAQQAAGFPPRGPHILRHTFCSHLAMRGAPSRVIQALAGHRSITTTERYMHLAPHAMEDAVQLLARPSDWRHRGDAGSKLLELEGSR